MAGRIGRSIYGSKLFRQLRERILSSEPLCRPCQRQGVDSAAEQLDHIKALADGGDPYAHSNLQPICRPCHQRKSAWEMRRRTERKDRKIVDLRGRPRGTAG